MALDLLLLREGVLKAMRGPELTVRADILRGLAGPQGKSFFIVVLGRRLAGQGWRHSCSCLQWNKSGL